MNATKSFSDKIVKQLDYLKVGNTVKVHFNIKEGDKSRVQIFEGRILKRHELKTVNATITVRRVTGGHGIERIFPLHSPLIEKIEIVKVANRVRKANLSYLRDRDGKKAKLPETVLNTKVNVILKEDEPLSEPEDDFVVPVSEDVPSTDEKITEEPKAEENTSENK